MSTSKTSCSQSVNQFVKRGRYRAVSDSRLDSGLTWDSYDVTAFAIENITKIEV